MFQGDLPDFLRHQRHFDTDYHDDYNTEGEEEEDERPFIDPSTPTNVTVTRGKTAMLACVVRNLGTASVSDRTHATKDCKFVFIWLEPLACS